MTTLHRRFFVVLFVFLSLLSVSSCRNSASRVVVYCAHDREFAEEILKQFEKDTGLKVDVRWDTEANKSVGLKKDLLDEKSSPRCDVHWNNEILGTIDLQKNGVLQPYASPAAVPFPAEYKASDHTWTAFAARARVLIVNTDKVKKDDFPKHLFDLTEARFKDKIAMAKPIFGTTATQAACLFQAWGADKASDFYRKLKANGVELVTGNKQVAVGVGVGQYAIGMTDTDDAVAEIEAGKPVAMVFPDGDTLFIPNTVAMVKGCPNPNGAKKLIDYLLSPDVEIKLAKSESRQIPLNPQVNFEPSLPPLSKMGTGRMVQTARMAKALQVDFAKAAAMWETSQAFLVKEFGLR